MASIFDIDFIDKILSNITENLPFFDKKLDTIHYRWTAVGFFENEGTVKSIGWHGDGCPKISKMGKILGVRKKRKWGKNAWRSEKLEKNEKNWKKRDAYLFNMEIRRFNRYFPIFSFSCFSRFHRWICLIVISVCWQESFSHSVYLLKRAVIHLVLWGKNK